MPLHCSPAIGPVRRPRTEKKTATPPESSGRQVAGDDAQRRQHRGPEPALTAGTDQVLAEVVGVGGLRPLHPDAQVSVSTTTASVART